MLRNGSAQGLALLDIDIKALAELVNLLRWCYIETEKAIEFPAALERLRANINDARWQRKIIYFQALHVLYPDWDEAGGRQELRKLGSIDDEADVETLQLYLDLFSDELTFSQRQDLITRILQFAETDVDRLHYRGALALEYLKIGDKSKAENELDAAISSFRESTGNESPTPYEKDQLAMSLGLLGELRSDIALLDQAIELFLDLLKDDCWTPAGRAKLLQWLGDAYRHKSEWSEARDSYVAALHVVPASICAVLLAQCLLHLESWEEAAEVISKVNPGDFSGGEYYDYVVAVAVVAIESEDRKRLLQAEHLLRNLKAPEPYFREQRDSLLLNVLETQRSGNTKTIVERARRALGGIAGAASRYLKLEPNVMGLGVNVGKILEDIARREQERRREDG